MALSNHDVIVQAIALIENRIGIAVDKQFQQEFKDLFERLAQGNSVSYLQKLQEQDIATAEWQRLINTFTIGETYFLREENHFNLLKKYILPKLILQRRQQGNHRLRVWSAGCASGEEPYSIAIILHQFLPDIANWDIEILGTDINDYALNTARHGVYRQWAFRDTDALFQQNYFNRVDGGFKIKPIIQSMVQFRRLNLLNADQLGKFDIIFCKNVMLYFEEPYMQQVEHHLYHALKSGGWLFLGQAEALRFQREHWQTHVFPGAPIYQHQYSEPLAVDDRQKQHRNDNDETQPTIVTNTVEEDYYQKAVEAVHEDDYTQAERCLSHALYHKHELIQSHTLLAWLFANRKAFPEAEAHITATLSLEPLHADAHYVSALVALEQHQIESALRALHMTLYCDKYHMLAAFMLGNLYAKTGELTRAYNQWAKIQRVIDRFQPSDYISDLSDLTAGQLDALITAHLNDT